ncbi:hypothetical protein RF11_06593 [Thelohanellus kitauei]|uniref:Uncharacterized protein n=1 Tax=Thelohanellus kitauei TaxID=669202 RepID=A0A0C2MPQ9_THEKT|nr:hypothetical protein RF11_06593 [Thelohanellus kitauei]
MSRLSSSDDEIIHSSIKSEEEEILFSSVISSSDGCTAISTQDIETVEENFTPNTQENIESDAEFVLSKSPISQPLDINVFTQVPKCSRSRKLNINTIDLAQPTSTMFGQLYVEFLTSRYWRDNLVLFECRLSKKYQDFQFYTYLESINIVIAAHSKFSHLSNNIIAIENPAYFITENIVIIPKFKHFKIIDEIDSIQPRLTHHFQIFINTLLGRNCDTEQDVIEPCPSQITQQEIFTMKITICCWFYVESLKNICVKIIGVDVSGGIFYGYLIPHEIGLQIGQMWDVTTYNKDYESTRCAFKEFHVLHEHLMKLFSQNFKPVEYVKKISLENFQAVTEIDCNFE